MTTPPATTSKQSTATPKKINLTSLTDDESQRHYHPLLSTTSFLIFGAFYVLSAMLPAILILIAFCVYKDIIHENAIHVMLGLVLVDFIVPLPGDGYRPGNFEAAQSMARLYCEGGANYYPAKSICHVTKDDLERDKASYILASYPHGLIGGGGHFFFPLFHAMGYHVICTTASIMKYVPFLRRMFSFCGSTDVSKESLKCVLDVRNASESSSASSSSPSSSLSYSCNIVHLVVGGIGEMFYTPGNHQTNETIILSKRKGFIKLALEIGADVIPTYTFGANQTYHRIFGPKSIMASLSSFLQVSLVTWFGRWWIPMSFIPFKVPVMDVVGEVFHVPKLKEGEKVTKEMVEKVHAEFCVAMRKLFDDHKRIYVEEMGAPDEWLTKVLKFEDE